MQDSKDSLELVESGVTFEPEITAFVCQYCADQAANSAGSTRQSYPSNVKIVRFPCTGKLDVQHILNAFECGADGVYVVACPEGNCHHINGNIAARRRLLYAQALLEEVGLDGARVELFHVTAAQGDEFAGIAARMTDKIRSIGPSPLKGK